MSTTAFYYLIQFEGSTIYRPKKVIIESQSCFKILCYLLLHLKLFLLRSCDDTLLLVDWIPAHAQPKRFFSWWGLSSGGDIKILPWLSLGWFVGCISVMFVTLCGVYNMKWKRWKFGLRPNFQNLLLAIALPAE